jgi:hypothetical protein
MRRLNDILPGLLAVCKGGELGGTWLVLNRSPKSSLRRLFAGLTASFALTKASGLTAFISD